MSELEHQNLSYAFSSWSYNESGTKNERKQQTKQANRTNTTPVCISKTSKQNEQIAKVVFCIFFLISE